MRYSKYNWTCPLCRQLNSYDIFEQDHSSSVLGFSLFKSQPQKAKTKCHYCLSVISLQLSREKKLIPTVVKKGKDIIKCTNYTSCSRAIKERQGLKDNYIFDCIYGIHCVEDASLSEVVSCYCPFTINNYQYNTNILQYIQAGEYTFINDCSKCTFRTANIDDVHAIVKLMCSFLRKYRIPYSVEDVIATLPYTVFNDKCVSVYPRKLEYGVEVSIDFNDLGEGGYYIPYYALQNKDEVVYRFLEDYLCDYIVTSFKK